MHSEPFRLAVVMAFSLKYAVALGARRCGAAGGNLIGALREELRALTRPDCAQ